MRVLISAEGNHEPAGQHFMVKDNHGLLLDLSQVKGTLHDPTILRTEWGQVIDGNVTRDGGTIVQRDGHKRRFWDAALLTPYLDAYDAKMAEHDAAVAAAAPLQMPITETVQ